MSRRNLIIGSIIIILIITGVLFSLLGRKKGTAPIQQPSTLPTNALPLAPLPNDGKATISTTPAVLTERERVELLARRFAERFGSFSPDTYEVHYQELVAQMTPQMQTWTKGQISQGYTGPILSWTTIAVSDTFSHYDESAGRASVLVAVQRSARVNISQAPRISYASLKLDLQRIDDTWLIDGAYWQ